MKIEEFNYVKKDGQESHRKVMVITTHKDYIDAIDFDKLDEPEIEKAKAVQLKYEADMSQIMKKSFRRFSKEGMSDLLVEEIKP